MASSTNMTGNIYNSMAQYSSVSKGYPTAPLMPTNFSNYKEAVAPVFNSYPSPFPRVEASKQHPVHGNNKEHLVSPPPQPSSANQDANPVENTEDKEGKNLIHDKNQDKEKFRPKIKETYPVNTEPSKSTEGNIKQSDEDLSHDKDLPDQHQAVKEKLLLDLTQTTKSFTEDLQDIHNISTQTSLAAEDDKSHMTICSEKTNNTTKMHKFSDTENTEAPVLVSLNDVASSTNESKQPKLELSDIKNENLYQKNYTEKNVNQSNGFPYFSGYNNYPPIPPQPIAVPQNIRSPPTSGAHLPPYLVSATSHEFKNQRTMSPNTAGIISLLPSSSHQEYKPTTTPRSKQKGRKRNPRTFYSNAHLKELNETFERTPFLSLPERASIAAKLGITEVQVKVWFQNRRAKEKKSGTVVERRQFKQLVYEESKSVESVYEDADDNSGSISPREYYPEYNKSPTYDSHQHAYPPPNSYYPRPNDVHSFPHAAPMYHHAPSTNNYGYYSNQSVGMHDNNQMHYPNIQPYYNQTQFSQQQMHPSNIAQPTTTPYFDAINGTKEQPKFLDLLNSPIDGEDELYKSL